MRDCPVRPPRIEQKKIEQTWPTLTVYSYGKEIPPFVPTEPVPAEPIPAPKSLFSSFGGLFNNSITTDDIVQLFSPFFTMSNDEPSKEEEREEDKDMNPYFIVFDLVGSKEDQTKPEARIMEFFPGAYYEFQPLQPVVTIMLCTRCGRNNHMIEMCFAKTHLFGYTL